MNLAYKHHMCGYITLYYWMRGKKKKLEVGQVNKGTLWLHFCSLNHIDLL